MVRVRRAWTDRVAAEYTSACVTAELLHWLMVLGLSPDTLATAQRIVTDELAHAELSREVLTAAGGDGAEVVLDRDRLRIRLDREAGLEERALSACARVFCCGESVAVPLFLRIRDVATEEVALRALDRIVKDEANHRAFGWNLLDELIERTGDRGRAWLGPRVGRYLADTLRVYSRPTPPLRAEQAAWGLVASDVFRDTVEVCLREVVTPRFEARGIRR